MITSEEDKKLVDKYKQTNIALRKQLINLNNEIDKILLKKSNKVGLQKLPSTTKKITDPNIIQQEVENLRKRAELLERDAEQSRAKVAINFHEKIREVEVKLQQTQSEMSETKRIIKEMERKDKIANVQAVKEHNSSNKWEKRVSALQEEITRYQKIQKQLVKDINYFVTTESKNAHLLEELAGKHQTAVMKRQNESKLKKKPLPVLEKEKTPPKRGNSIGEEEWKDLKSQFLIFKESKQNEEWMLNEENERLRIEIKDWQRKIKEKKKRVQNILENEARNKNRQSKIYSTLQDPKSKLGRNYRYRERNNSVQYQTKQ